jgi:hypothetical protein
MLAKHSPTIWRLNKDFVTKSIHISVPHRLTPELVHERLQKGITDFRASPASKMGMLEDKWEGQTLHLTAKMMGQSIDARVEPRANSVEIDVDLPWAMAMLAGTITKELEQRGRLLLEEKK